MITICNKTSVLFVIIGGGGGGGGLKLTPLISLITFRKLLCLNLKLTEIKGVTIMQGMISQSVIFKILLIVSLG